MTDKSLGVSPPSSGPGSTLQPQAASAAIPDATCDGQSTEDRPFVYKGMLSGESFGMAAERWAQWCARRSMTMLPEFLRYAADHEKRYSDHGCICRGNWRAIVKESEDLLDKTFIDSRTGDRYVFFGVVHGSDDYYYGMVGKGRHALLSCVGSIEGHGFTEAPREGSLPDRANPARDESPKAIEPDRDSDAPKTNTVRAKVFAIIPELRMAQVQTADEWQYVVSAKWQGDEFFDSLTDGAELELEVEDDDLPRVLAARIIK